MNRKFEIIIVDDDIDMASNLRDVLEAEGYGAAVAGGGQTALALCRERVFDLALIDIKLPDISGVELSEKLAKLSHQMEHIIITGHASLESAIEVVKQRSVVAYETKPLDMEHLLSIIRQVAERRRAEEALRESEARYQDTLDSMIGGCQIISFDWRYLYVNDTAARHGRRAKEELLGHTMMEMYPGIEDTEMFAFLQRCMEKRIPHRMENEFTFPEGAKRWFELSIHSVPEGIFILSLDITERKQAEETLRESEGRYRLLSAIDELTGLYNRRHFYEVLETEIYRTQRYGRPFSLVVLDLDGFKEYNDRFGHINGDAVLKSLADTLKSAFRKSDMAFRYGGDEFAIILPATDVDRTRQIVDRIRSKWLRTPKAEYATLESPLGFSAGIAQFPENAETADGLVFLADTALYHSKSQGGYKCTLVSDLGDLPPGALSPTTMDQVYALAATVDAKDPYTYGHSKMVAAIAESIGKTMGLSIRQLGDLHAAALLHDIGKIGVPDSVLAKPGKLTSREWELIKKHSAEGANIVSYIRALAASVPMILYHHERYDGTGYPDGLKGEDIPLGARIISIADAYDTMTTPRLYRGVISQEEAFEELRRCAGTQFDTELVEVLCRAMTETVIQVLDYSDTLPGQR